VGSRIAASLSELRKGRKSRTTSSKGHSTCYGSKNQDKPRPVSDANSNRVELHVYYILHNSHKINSYQFVTPFLNIKFIMESHCV